MYRICFFKIIFICGSIFSIIQLYSKYSSKFGLKENIIDHILQERKQNVELNCKKYKKEFREFFRKYKVDQDRKSVFFIENSENSFFWCRVPKASSSSWVKLFAIEKGILEKSKRGNGCERAAYTRKVLSNRLKNLKTRKAKKLFSFMIMRHPFNRVLSAYRDRFFVNTDSSPECLPYEHSKVAKFRRKYGNNILKNYRVLQPNDSKYEETPTFEEFVHYLVNTPPHLFDRHWEPIVYKCHICLFEYDLIAKVETIDDDSNNILKRLGFQTNLTKFHVTNGGTDKKTQEYFSKLDNDLLKKLHKVYELDFKFFGYSIDEYLSVKNKKS